jgi:hypothetical protein
MRQLGFNYRGFGRGYDAQLNNTKLEKEAMATPG